MTKWAVRLGIASLAIIVVASVFSSSARATLGGSGMCWVPDWEFPIPCGDIDED